MRAPPWPPAPKHPPVVVVVWGGRGGMGSVIRLRWEGYQGWCVRGGRGVCKGGVRGEVVHQRGWWGCGVVRWYGGVVVGW